MILAEKHIYKPTHKYYAELDNLCFLSKNLYNATLYDVRQYYFSTGKYKNYNKVNFEFTHNNQPDYRALPAKVAKHTQKLVDKNFKSFFALLKKKNQGKYDKPISIIKCESTPTSAKQVGGESLGLNFLFCDIEKYRKTFHEKPFA